MNTNNRPMLPVFRVTIVMLLMSLAAHAQTMISDVSARSASWFRAAGGGPRPCGWYGEFDVLFLTVSQADGVKDADQGDASFSRSVAPRFSLGYQLPEGFGIRVRCLSHEDTTVSVTPRTMTTDIFMIDAEAFQLFYVTHRTSVELAAGARYTEFEFDRGGNDIYSLKQAFGMVGSCKVAQHTRMGDFYATGRGGIVHGEGRIESDFSVEDLLRTQFSLEVGFQNSVYCGRYRITGRIGYMGLLLSDYIAANDEDDITSSLGLHGVLAGITINR